MLNRPSPPVTATRGAPRHAHSAVTVTPGSTPSVLSVTRPVIPPLACAHAACRGLGKLLGKHEPDRGFVNNLVTRLFLDTHYRRKAAEGEHREERPKTKKERDAEEAAALQAAHIQPKHLSGSEI